MSLEGGREGRRGEGMGGEGRGGDGRGGDGRGREGMGGEGEGSPLSHLAIFFFNISVARYKMTSLNDCGNVNGEKNVMLA